MGVLLLVVMAWRSEGFYHPDEHYQLLEFANYKSGLAIREGLAWEFHDQIRPGLQPFIAYAFMGGLRAVGLTNPFHLALMLRLLSGLLSLILMLRTADYLRSQNSTGMLYRGFLVLGFFLWFAPFLNVRFSSENWGALAFFSGVLVLWKSADVSDKQRLFGLVCSGLLISLSFQFRYQMAFGILGWMAWLVFYKKLSRLQWLYVFAGILSGFLLGLIADKWLYGNWQLTPFRYFHSNIIEHKAASFGIKPWWFYFTEFFTTIGPVLNVVAIVLLGYGLFTARQHAFTWIFIPFLAGHLFVDHKELRFMFPMLIPFIYLVSAGWMALPIRITSSILVRLLGMVLLVINSFLLVYRLKEAAHVPMPYFRYLYDQATQGVNLTVFYYETDSKFHTNSIYGPGNLRMTFYRPAGLIQLPIHHPGEMDQYDLSKTRNFIINVNKTLPPSRTKDQGLAFKYSPWTFEDLRRYRLFKPSDINWKIFYIRPR